MCQNGLSLQVMLFWTLLVSLLKFFVIWISTVAKVMTHFPPAIPSCLPANKYIGVLWKFLNIINVVNNLYWQILVKHLFPPSHLNVLYPVCKNLQPCYHSNLNTEAQNLPPPRINLINFHRLWNEAVHGAVIYCYALWFLTNFSFQMRQVITDCFYWLNSIADHHSFMWLNCDCWNLHFIYICLMVLCYSYHCNYYSSPLNAGTAQKKHRSVREMVIRALKQAKFIVLKSIIEKFNLKMELMLIWSC